MESTNAVKWNKTTCRIIEVRCVFIKAELWNLKYRGQQRILSHKSRTPFWRTLQGTIQINISQHLGQSNALHEFHRARPLSHTRILGAPTKKGAVSQIKDRWWPLAWLQLSHAPFTRELWDAVRIYRFERWRRRTRPTTRNILKASKFSNLIAASKFQWHSIFKSF